MVGLGGGWALLKHDQGMVGMVVVGGGGGGGACLGVLTLSMMVGGPGVVPVGIRIGP